LVTPASRTARRLAAGFFGLGRFMTLDLLPRHTGEGRVGESHEDGLREFQI
jgi:hypothetical protein